MYFTPFSWVCWAHIVAWEKKKEQKHEYSAILVCALGTDQKRIETKICQKFSGNSVELCVSVDAYGIGCGIVLDHFQ